MFIHQTSSNIIRLSHTNTEMINRLPQELTSLLALRFSGSAKSSVAKLLRPQTLPISAGIDPDQRLLSTDASTPAADPHRHQFHQKEMGGLSIGFGFGLNVQRTPPTSDGRRRCPARLVQRTALCLINHTKLPRQGDGVCRSRRPSCSRATIASSLHTICKSQHPISLNEQSC